MTKYCNACGNELDDENVSFCPNCGAKIEKEIQSETNNNTLILGLVGVIIILIVGIGFITGGFGLLGEHTSILIISQSPVSNSGNFSVQLTDNNQGIAGKPVEITFKNENNSYSFNTTTDSTGLATIIPNVEAGNYEVTCSFAGDSKYSKSTTTGQITVESKPTQLNSHQSSSRTEPDYESFSYSHSFEETDTNGDGYVYLSDMNIAHTPQNIQNRMFADSDDDGDGRLNRAEYYKFMYKLNYDRSSYGL